MILTKEQTEKRLTSNSNIANPEAEVYFNSNLNPNIEIIRKDGINNHNGRGTGKNLTEEERVAIGVIASVTDSKTAAELFSISTSHVSDLKNGNRTVGLERVRDTQLLDAIATRLESTKLTVQERAAEKLLSTLGLFDEPGMQDRLRNSKPKEIASVAKDMSQVMRNMTSSNNKREDEGKKNVKIIIHAPKEAHESSFDTIEIGV